mgnify:FL=1
MADLNIDVTPFCQNHSVLVAAQRSEYLAKLLGKLNKQILHLKRRLRDLSKRYNTVQNPGIRRSLAIRLDVTEGMRYAYYELARAAADELGVIISRAFGSVILLDIDYNDEDNDFYGEENDESNDAEMMLLQSERR